MFRAKSLVTLAVPSLLAIFALTAGPAGAQQTLGGITGVVTDSSNSLVPKTTVTLVGDQTQLTRTATTNRDGSYEFADLPIGTYTLTFAHEGFATQNVPSILVQADRTTTVNASLKIGQVGTTITVQVSPMMNAVDTTNGYILEKQQIQSVPLPTGSFTGLAILSAGVSAELPSGSGANAGLGNQPIWANGQRDTSNSFLLNGVDASNLFNGKSTSQVASSRIVNNTGVSGAASTGVGVIQSTASPYLAIGQALPTPAPESIEEVRVNTSMYDAQQGSTSGAHIDMSTASGTNNLHGSAYWHRATNWLNAAPYFFNADPTVPSDQKVPALHRNAIGGTVGGALIKNKLFGFASYQHVHDGDGEIGISRLTVPFGLTDDDRTASGLAAIANENFGTPITASQVSPIALGLFQYKLPNGQYLIPSANSHIPSPVFPDNAYVPGTAYFTSDQAVGNLDWNKSEKDIVSVKYYFQHDPTVAPYAYSMVAGFPQRLNAGSQVFSINNTQTPRPTLSITETLGFARENVYSSIGQPFGPSQFGINTFGSSQFPGISIVDILGNSSPNNVNYVSNASLNIGEGAASQGAFTGVFQNRLMPSANAIWNVGRHTFTFGGSFSYTQLNAVDNRTGQGIVASADLSQFILGLVTTNDDFQTTSYLLGDANRYYRANETGEYFQDKYQARPNLSLTGGLRFDWDGGLKEKYGRLYNFNPALYSYDENTGDITSNGFIVAGNNKQFHTPGVSDTTLTGRQWGFAPRLGLAWSPKKFDSKVVIRAGTGIYYDRGELFSYLSPGYAAGETTGGPFGVNQAPPFVNTQVCSSTYLYQGFIPTCDEASGASLANPWGPTRGPEPTGNPEDISNYLPNRSEIIDGQRLFSFAAYDRANKLPYTMNYTLDIQWQPRQDLAVDVGYVGNSGRHAVIPVPFNQPEIATPSHPIHGQQYTYGYTVLDSSGNPLTLPNNQGQMLATYEGGNADLRVPYVGYSAESEMYKAIGISNYNALQTHVEKRLSHGLQFGFSYTWSHGLDEQSAMGLFYNGNNPLDLRSAYGSSDFDRTHIIQFNYLYQLPRGGPQNSWRGRILNDWAIQGIATIQSGQPYSVIDYTGAVGSIFYGVSDGITNPIVPLAPGCTAYNAVTGANGAGGTPALKASCFTVPLLQPGDLGGAIPPGDTFETDFTSGQRNIFRQSWQKRTDISVVKGIAVSERVSAKFSVDIFNLTNTASFDIPIDDVSQNQYYNDFPSQGFPLYNAPYGLGSVSKTIGGPRNIQMSLRLAF
jgi:hypothetical protein